MNYNITDTLNIEFSNGVVCKYNPTTGKSFVSTESAKEYAEKHKYVIAKIQVPTKEELLQDAKSSKCEEINNSTMLSIVSTAGTLEQQANYNAKYTELLGKKVDGTITEDELALMGKIKDGWSFIETVRNDGNALEVSVQAMETIEEVEAVEVV